MTMPDPAGRQQSASPDALVALQRQIDRLERPTLAKAKPGDVLTLGVPEIDGHLPRGGLAPASLHAISGAESLTPAIGFAAALLGRATRASGAKRCVLWCRRGHDLYAPGLSSFGLTAANLIIVNTVKERDLLWAMEEGLRSGAMDAVLGEPQVPSPTALRRLQLAAETGGTTALLLDGVMSDGETGRSIGAGMTHWRVGAIAAPVAALDSWPRPSRWWLELLRCRGGTAGSWPVDWHETIGGDETAYREQNMKIREKHANDNTGTSSRRGQGIETGSGTVFGAPGRLRLAQPVCDGSAAALADTGGAAERRRTASG